MVTGSMQADGVVVGEMSASFLNGATLKAKAAFVSSRSGQTHGWTENQTWSPATIVALQALRYAMEADLGRLHLAGGENPEVPAQNGATEASGPGLGEHLRGEGRDADQL